MKIERKSESILSSFQVSCSRLDLFIFSQVAKKKYYFFYRFSVLQHQGSNHFESGRKWPTMAHNQKLLMTTKILVKRGIGAICLVFQYQIIADTQAQLSVFELGQKLQLQFKVKQKCLEIRFQEYKRGPKMFLLSSKSIQLNFFCCACSKWNCVRTLISSGSMHSEAWVDITFVKTLCRFH